MGHFLVDRSWVNRRIVANETVASIEFLHGVEAFLAYAYKEPKCMKVGDRIRCPCLLCHNDCYESADTIRKHLYAKGFVRGYDGLWWGHGEFEQVNEPTSSSDTADLGEAEATTSTHEGEVYRMDDMVHDLAGHEFDLDPDEEEPMNPEAEHFFKLLGEGREPLWKGCKKHTTLSAVALFLNIKADHNISKECFEAFLRGVKSMMPEDETLPNSLYLCKKMLKKLGLGYEKIHACENDCMLFYKENATLSNCTTCGHSRFKDNNPKVPKKVLRYFPIGPRLKRLYISSRTARHMTWHAENPAKAGELRHPSDGQAWKELDRAYPNFSRDPRNVRLGLSTDGFNPFGHSSTPYSCWPVIVTPYNLPPDMCMKQPYMFLSLLIPGPKSPQMELDVYMRPLIDELKELWKVGTPAWDVTKRQTFNLKAAVLWTISDFPALGLLSGWSTHGRLSCPYCMEHSKAFQLQNGRKNCFFDCHRRFLPNGHVFRRNRRDFRKGKVELDGPPPHLSGKQVFEQVRRLKFIPFGKMQAKAQTRGVTHNWKKRSIFWELPYWSTNLIRHNLDVMHIEKNVFDNIFNTVMDIKDRTKDNVKARMDLKQICNRPELELYESTAGKTIKPHAKYVLTKNQRDEVCRWITTLKLPDGYASNIARCVGRDKLSGMKSHDCHVFIERLMPLAFKNLLHESVWNTLTELSRFFKDLCSKVLYVENLEKMESAIVEIICKMERFFPPSFFDSMEHLPIHLVREAKVGGPVTYRWMYSFERFMGILKRKVKNKAQVEGSICEAYSLEEISTFMSDYFPDDVLTKATRLPRNDDGGDTELHGRVYVFGLPGRAYGKTTRKDIGMDLIRLAHTYILMNCEEIDEYINRFVEELRSKRPGISDSEIDTAKDSTFSTWLQGLADTEQNFPKELIPLAMGPLRMVESRSGLKVNGLDFHAKKYSERRKTTNYGLKVNFTHADGEMHDYYGEVEEIIEISYAGKFGGAISLFKCRWFDSRKCIRVDKHGIVEIDVSTTAYSEQPFVLPMQADQVYYTPSASRKRERGDWKSVIETPARIAPSGHLEEAFQVEKVTSPLQITIDADIQTLNVIGEEEEVEIPVSDVRGGNIQIVDEDTDEEDEFNSDDETDEDNLPDDVDE